MGWLFRCGSTRRGLIEERIEGWERSNTDGLVITSTCLAHCYRGGSFSGVLWSVWERTFTKDGEEAEPTQRWIQCDLLRYSKHDGAWGYKDMGIQGFGGNVRPVLLLVPNEISGHGSH